MLTKYFNWNYQTTKALYDLRKTGMTWKKIAEKIDSKNLTKRSCGNKYANTNWKDFFDKNKTKKDHTSYWEADDLIQIFTLRKAGLSHSEIAKKIGVVRHIVSNIFQRHPDWEKEFSSMVKKGSKKTAVTQELVDSAITDNLIKGIIEVARHDITRLKEMTKDQFYNKITLDSKSPLTFTELKKRAIYELEQIGLSYPSSQVLGKGTYIICGDSHGKHTRTGMFRLIKNLSDHLKANRIIHVGHFVDDDNDCNYNWNDITNLTIIAKEEELKILAKNKIMHDIVRKEIILGEKLSVQNQDLITDYVAAPLSRSITPEYFPSSTITNLHRHEFDTRCLEEGTNSIVASPGCLCEPHIVYTIKQQDFTDGRTVKQTFPVGYKKYRRMQHQYKIWQQGILVVHIDSKGDFSIIQCRVHKTSGEFTTSYFDKIITEKEIIDPDEKTVVNSDLHSDLHDRDVLDITDQICQDYKPQVHINLGDISENKSINHHIFSEIGCMRVNKSLLKESASTCYLITRMNTWAKRKVLMLGNHERFYRDFFRKFPQFEDFMNFKFINGINDLSIEVINLKQMKKMSNVNYIHGDMWMIGQTGGHRLDKVFRTYGRNTIMGHCHYPSCRSDCYTVGLSGKMDLQYNETNASKWMHSIILINSFEDKAFITNVCISNNKTLINNKSYVPISPEKWDIPSFKAKIVYEFSGEQDYGKYERSY